MKSIISPNFKIQGNQVFWFYVNFPISEYYEKIDEIEKIREKQKVTEVIVEEDCKFLEDSYKFYRESEEFKEIKCYDFYSKNGYPIEPITDEDEIK